MKKIRVNITVDLDNLNKAKTKLKLFGGKMSTLFNSYLEDFVNSIDKPAEYDSKSVALKIKDIEKRLEHLERKN